MYVGEHPQLVQHWVPRGHCVKFQLPQSKSSGITWGTCRNHQISVLLILCLLRFLAVKETSIWTKYPTKMPLGRVISARMFTVVAEYLECLQRNAGVIAYLYYEAFHCPSCLYSLFASPLPHLFLANSPPLKSFSVRGGRTKCWSLQYRSVELCRVKAAELQAEKEMVNSVSLLEGEYFSYTRLFITVKFLSQIYRGTKNEGWE